MMQPARRESRGTTQTLDRGQDAGRVGYTVARDPQDIEAIWTMRKRAVGLLGNVDGPSGRLPSSRTRRCRRRISRLYPRVPRATRRCRRLYGMFGHVDAGVLHVRPALDLTREDHVPMVRRISDAVWR